MIMADIPENQSLQEQASAQSQVVTAPGGTPAQPSGAWLSEIRAAKKHMQKFWEKGDQITKRFLDKREAGEESVNKYNLFTVNTEILKATLYARFPKPIIDREFGDQNDDVARVAAMMLERCVRVKKRDDYDESMKAVVQDWLIPGLGQLWFRYEPTIVQQPVEGVLNAEGKPLMLDRIMNEEVIADYIYWKDFLWSPARIWKQVRWVARRIKLNKDDATKRFGEAIANQLSYKRGALSDDESTSQSDTDIVQYCEIFEIWCKRTKKVYWVTEGADFCLDVRDDPLKLPNFFPCPKPLLALHATDDLVPRADYLMVQDQYNELDDLNNRITVLERAVKVVGVYDGANEEIKRIFTEMMQNQIIAMASFRDFAEKGGFKGAIDWIPIDMVVKAIESLRSYRQELIAQIYELTGISDIMRGATKASETLGAQELKAQYGAVRTQDRQLSIASFVEECFEIKAELVRTKYQPQTIVTRSNIDYTEDVKYKDAALQFLKDPSQEWRIEVYPDSMAIPEFNSERDARMMFMRALAEILTAAAPILQQDAGAGTYILKIIQWAASSFRVGRSIETVLDEAINALQKKLAQPAPPAPPPPTEIAKAQNLLADADKKTAETQMILIEAGRLTKTPIEDPNAQPDRPPLQ